MKRRERQARTAKILFAKMPEHLIPKRTTFPIPDISPARLPPYCRLDGIGQLPISHIDCEAADVDDKDKSWEDMWLYDLAWS
jgi:hypothetical protein